MQFGTEYRLVLEGFTPDTIPMSRLAEYLRQMAKMLGYEGAVHFQRVENNCTALVAKIDPRTAGKVRAQVRAIREKKAPADAMNASAAINRMVAEDKTTGLLREQKGVVIRFPGTRPAQNMALEVPDEGTVIGYLYMLSDAGREFHARIKLESGNTLMCTVTDEIAKKLRSHLFETVKVSGPGIWARDTDGAWAALKLEIKEVVPVKSTSLRSVIDELRQIDIDWPEDVFETNDGHDQNGSHLQ